MTSVMTKGERSELTSLINQGARVMKAAAVERSAELMADFERQLASVHSFDQDDIWKAAHKEARKAVKDAQIKIAERCDELGIPREFAPTINSAWFDRGQNATKERRAELRQAVKAKIAALERSAKTEIERLNLEAKTELVANGLLSDAAKIFLKNIPSFEVLMPTLKVSKAAGLLE